MKRRRVTIKYQHWPYRFPVAISRGVIKGQDVVVVTLTGEGAVGRGESSPSARFGESAPATVRTLEALLPELEAGLGRKELQHRLPPGAARNAIDCALWDLDAKLARVRVWELAGLPAPGSIQSTQTIGLDSPDAMALQAATAWSPLLKLKLGGEGDLDRVRAVRRAAPTARLLVDVNEAWTAEQLQRFCEPMGKLGVELIEQPMPAALDAELERIRSPIPLVADESVHGADTLGLALGRYQGVNIKLDKTGGLTEALRVKSAAQKLGLHVMVGCMGGTSLAMAPALLVAAGAMIADLDGPRLLEHDRSPSLHYRRGLIGPIGPDLWG